MLKIEFVAYLDGTVIQSDYDNHVLRVDLTKWTQLEKDQRKYILEDANHHYISRQNWLTVNERRLNDALDKMAEDDDVDYADALKGCETELEELRHNVRDFCDLFNRTPEHRLRELQEHVDALAKAAKGDETVDNARMSVPDSDEEFDWTASRLTKADMPEAEDHIIRAYDMNLQQVVYWQEKWAWRSERSTARRFTRMKALELANRTNIMKGNDDIINVCAIKMEGEV